MEISQNNHKSKNRKESIDEVLKELELLKNKPDFNQYAINENIAFFEATKSIFKYIRWLITKAPKIDGERLLEINDLLPKYDLIMHRKLIEIEKRKFPGLIAPLVDQISEMILNANKLMTLINIGCGGMEAERQIINNLIINKYNNRLVFIGVDRSLTTGQLIRENFKDLFDEIEFYEIDNLSDKKLQEAIDRQEKQFLIFLCKNDIFQLDEYFTLNVFDLSFSVLFKHHLNNEDKKLLDGILDRISNRIIEYDGYLSWLHLILPHTVVAWSNPIFLNASIFSDLRYYKKSQVKTLYNIKKYDSLAINFFNNLGIYLIEK